MRKGITAEQVREICEGLAAEGKKPTIKLVRQALGGIGSETTICKLLGDWRQAHQPTLPPIMNVPQETAASLAAWVEQASRERIDAMQETLQTVRGSEAELLNILETKEDTIQTLTEENARLQAELADSQAQIKALAENLAMVKDIREALPELKAGIGEAKQAGLDAAQAIQETGKALEKRMAAQGEASKKERNEAGTHLMEGIARAIKKELDGRPVNHPTPAKPGPARKGRGLGQVG